ncbi:hypothetical protein F5890DRAFT_1560611 [Lentinula detonsa]|uniref:SAP domain-containing protein n=1 Tax=Lentinula detonsa TaxID=2804962 RepID=A0AA38PN74_9AGAR|nr:hypothetical protein F5890DRAFT_1560611 [Lentinula detonsa]
MHLGYLGLFETHLRKIWGINHEKKGGDGLEPMPEAKKPSKASLRQLLNGIRGNLPILRNVLMAENKASLWYICFMLNLRTGLRNKQQLVEQILQWRSRSTPEAVPEVPFLSYDQVPDGWEASETAKNSGELSDSEASETSLSSSVTNSDILPLVSRRAPLFNFNKDADFEDLKSKLLNLSFKAPSLTRPAKEVLQALCQDLNIAYNAQDTKKHLITRLMIYRQENGADDDSNGSEVRYNKLKRQFEEKNAPFRFLLA